MIFVFVSGGYQQLEGASAKGRHYEAESESRHHRYFRSSASPGARSDASLSPVPLVASSVSYESNGDGGGDGTVLCLSSSSGFNANNGHCNKRAAPVDNAANEHGRRVAALEGRRKVGTALTRRRCRADAARRRRRRD